MTCPVSGLWAVTPRRLASFWWPRWLGEEMLAGVQTAVPLLGAAWCLPRDWIGLRVRDLRGETARVQLIIRPFPLRLPLHEKSFDNFWPGYPFP